MWIFSGYLYIPDCCCACYQEVTKLDLKSPLFRSESRDGGGCVLSFRGSHRLLHRLLADRGVLLDWEEDPAPPFLARSLLSSLIPKSKCGLSPLEVLFIFSRVGEKSTSQAVAWRTGSRNWWHNLNWEYGIIYGRQSPLLVVSSHITEMIYVISSRSTGIMYIVSLHSVETLWNWKHLWNFFPCIIKTRRW